MVIIWLMMVNHILQRLTGWWLYLPTSLKNDGVKVSWDDCLFPINMESHSKFHGSSHHQPENFGLQDGD